MLRKKGMHKIESPEKFSAETYGIELTRGEGPRRGGKEEYLTGGNGVADERGVADLVLKFIRRA